MLTMNEIVEKLHNQSARFEQCIKDGEYGRAKVLVDDLAVRKSLSWDSSAVAGRVQKNEVFTIAEGPVKVGSGSMYKLKSGLYITASKKYVTTYYK